MLKAAVIVLLLCGVLFFAGCQSPGHDKEQNIQKYSRIADLNRRMLAEDFEKFWLLDRPTRLTKWQTGGN